jgi:transposase
LILKVKDLKGFAAATSTPEMKEWDKENGYKDICYSLTPVE